MTTAATGGPIPGRTRPAYDVMTRKTAALFSERSSDGNTLHVSWNPVAFAVFCMIGQLKQARANMARHQAESNRRWLDVHDKFAAVKLADMKRQALDAPRPEA